MPTGYFAGGSADAASVEVHSKIYHRWISDRHRQEAFEKAMGRSDRFLPPPQ